MNIIAHSMGGLIVRRMLQTDYAEGEAAKSVNKVVTLGTPHQGIAFQRLGNLKWLPMLEAADELEQFDPKKQENEKDAISYKRLGRHFPLELKNKGGEWLLPIEGVGFRATFGIELEFIGKDGRKPLA